MTKASPPRIIGPTEAAHIVIVIPMAWNWGIVHSITERKHKQDFDFKESWNFKVKIRGWKMSKIQSRYLLSKELLDRMLGVEKPAKKRSKQ